MKNKLTFVISLIGAVGVFLGLVLSEVLYSEILEFSQTPIVYRIFFIISIVLSLLGIISGMIFRDSSTVSKNETLAEVIGIIVSFVCLFISFAFPEGYTQDLLFCITSGALFAFAIMYFHSISSLKFSRRKKAQTEVAPTQNRIYLNGNIKISAYLVEEIEKKLVSNEASNEGVSSKDYSKLNREEKVVALYYEFITQINESGFYYYLTNPSGRHLYLLAKVLEVIKADEIKDIYKDVINLFPEKFPEDDDMMHNLIYSICSDEIMEKISSCDKKFKFFKEDYHNLIIYNYVKENANKFDLKKEVKDE